MSFRIVVCGSRNWMDGPEANIIRNKLALVVEDVTTLGGSVMSGRCVTEAEIIIAHGGAKGADNIADVYARRRKWIVEVFHADWHTHGRAAGPMRNKTMLDRGADVVLAFPIGDRGVSPGTWGCVDLAASRGIPLAVFPRSTFEGTVAG